MQNRSYKNYINKIHELPLIMAIVLNSLLVGSVFFGFFGKEYFIGFGTCFFGHSVYNNAINFIIFEFEFIPVYLKNIPTIFTTIGIFCGYFSYRNAYMYKTAINKNKIATKFFNNK
jgi:NADH-ubiquinone oxidoreductase chain 5